VRSIVSPFDFISDIYGVEPVSWRAVNDSPATASCRQRLGRLLSFAYRASIHCTVRIDLEASSAHLVDVHPGDPLITAARTTTYSVTKLSQMKNRHGNHGESAPLERTVNFAHDGSSKIGAGRHSCQSTEKRKCHP